MYRKKLQALKYPLTDSFDFDDELKFRNLIVWLEDHKIRIYPMEGREGLRNTEDVAWPKIFDKYLNDLELAFAQHFRRQDLLNVLLSFAVRYEYNDRADELNKASSVNIKAEKEQAPKIVAVNPLDKLDFSSPDFIQGVHSLADLLKVTKNPNHLITLEACAKLIKTRYSKTAVRNGEHLCKKGESFPFQEVDRSFDSGDNILNQAAKILRLLFIMDLRDLQTTINECIVAVQAITANPKTDTKLGKVGF